MDALREPRKKLTEIDPIEIQAEIDRMEENIPHDELPSAYDALVWWRDHGPKPRKHEEEIATNPLCAACGLASCTPSNLSTFCAANASESGANGARFVAVKDVVMRTKRASGKLPERVAVAVSHTSARRIANALNRYKPTGKGY
jgi:hypothetical protein